MSPVKKQSRWQIRTKKKKINEHLFIEQSMAAGFKDSRTQFTNISVMPYMSCGRVS